MVEIRRDVIFVNRGRIVQRGITLEKEEEEEEEEEEEDQIVHTTNQWWKSEEMLYL